MYPAPAPVLPDLENLDARITGIRTEIHLLERVETRHAAGNHRLAALQVELDDLEAQRAAL